MDRYVESPGDLAEVVAALRAQPRVAVDTEAASFHRYRDRIYLVQLAAPGQSVIVDPVAIADLAPVGGLLGDPAVEKVFHDADYDLRVLDRDYGYSVRRVFDTRIAAQLVGEPAIGLAALLEKHLGVKLTKTHQKADWSQRPLPPGMLAYAADDTRHLLALRDALAERLRAVNRLAWAQEEFERLEALRWTAADGDEPYLRLKGAKQLAPQSLAALRELVRWRESIAARDDRALFRVIGNEELLAVARTLPQDAAALSAVPGLPPTLARRHGPALLDAVARAVALPPSEWPTPARTPRPPRDPAFDVRVERLKLARNRVAAELGLDPGVLCGRTTLEAVARAGLDGVPDLRRWQLEVLGAALAAAL